MNVGEGYTIGEELGKGVNFARVIPAEALPEHSFGRMIQGRENPAAYPRNITPLSPINPLLTVNPQSMQQSTQINTPKSTNKSFLDDLTINIATKKQSGSTELSVAGHSIGHHSAPRKSPLLGAKKGKIKNNIDAFLEELKSKHDRKGTSLMPFFRKGEVPQRKLVFIYIYIYIG